VTAAKAATPSAAQPEVSRLLRDLPSAGPQRLGFTLLPPQCRPAHSATQAVALSKSRRPTPFVHRGGATFPIGTYQTTVTKQQFANAGLDGSENQQNVTYWTTYYSNGKFHQWQKPAFPDNNTINGTWSAKGDKLTMRFPPAAGLGDEVTRWSYANGALTFALVSVSDPGSKLIYTARSAGQ
jgi:hypothetical protein